MTPNAKSRFLVHGVISCVLLVPALASADEVFKHITVPANAEISGAGNAGLPDSSGVAPIMETLPAGATVVTVVSVKGLITLNNGTGNGSNDPDGTVVEGTYGLSLPDASEMNPYGGISGITGPGAGYLVGVFTTGAPPTGPAPASLDFVATDPGGIDPNFTSLSPQLYQVFFIGDGLTGDGSGARQQFNVPAGATTLYLGISDAPGFYGGPGAYGDNIGSFTVTAVASSNPLPVATLSVTTPTVTAGSGGSAAFKITLSAAPTAPLTVKYTIKGTAANGVDYELLTGTKKFKAGKTSKPILIVPEGDLEGASKKTVKIALASGTGYTAASTKPLTVKILAP